MKNILTIILCIACLQVSAQEENEPATGQPVPDLVLHNVEHYSKRTLTTADLQGKWTVLDFWTLGCTACVKGFPHVNDMQNKFDNIRFVLVTDNSARYKNIRKVYESFRTRWNLQLPIAYDSAMFKKFNVRSVPFILILDPEGKVYAVTYGSELTEENLAALVANKRPVFASRKPEKLRYWEYWVNPDTFHTAVTYRAALAPYQKEFTTGSTGFDERADSGLYQATKISLANLYLSAYDWYNKATPFGNEYYRQPVLDVKDKTVFETDFKSGKGYYNYCLIVPPNNAGAKGMQQWMQSDLERFFNYTVRIETREMPYWRLTAAPGAAARLASKGGKYMAEFEPDGMHGKGINIMNIITSLHMYNDNGDLSFVDETGIKGNIDISFDAVMTDMTDIQRALKMHGLILEKVNKPMKVLVLGDRPAKEPITTNTTTYVR